MTPVANLPPVSLIPVAEIFAEIFASKGAPPVSTTPAAKLPLVSTTPVANLPPVLLIPVANCHRCR